MVVDVWDVRGRPTPETIWASPCVNCHVKVVKHSTRKVQDGVDPCRRVALDARHSSPRTLLEPRHWNRAIGNERQNIVRAFCQLFYTPKPVGHDHPVEPWVLVGPGHCVDALEGNDEGIRQLEQYPLNLRSTEVLQQWPHCDVVDHENNPSGNGPHRARRLAKAALLNYGVKDNSYLHGASGRVRQATPGVRLPLEKGHLHERVKRHRRQKAHEGILNESTRSGGLICKESVPNILAPLVD
mmetsp:Transcript_21908/g.38774  ORF Transcript_21908/g.38774 Transcript_21908/m.38774 type:complete len:241 (+) Transcript_21908:514-1236(+)